MPFQDALKARLDLMTPSRGMVVRCLQEHPPRLSPGVYVDCVPFFFCQIRFSSCVFCLDSQAIKRFGDVFSTAKISHT